MILDLREMQDEDTDDCPHHTFSITPRKCGIVLRSSEAGRQDQIRVGSGDLMRRLGGILESNLRQANKKIKELKRAGVI